MQITVLSLCWPYTSAWLNAAFWKQILVGQEQQARHALLHMPLAYLHGQLIGSLLNDGFLMGWEDGLLNTEQLLRFNYRTRLLLSQRWHPGGGLGPGGRWVPDSCLGSHCWFPQPHQNTHCPSCCSPTHPHNMRENNTWAVHSSVDFLQKAAKCENAQGGCWEPPHSASLGIRLRQTCLQMWCLRAQWHWAAVVPQELGVTAVFWGRSSLVCSSLQEEAHDSSVPPSLLSQ